MHIYLSRHAEAKKNVIDSHGGTGSSLTSVGCDQALGMARSLEAKPPQLVLAVSRLQCLETARIIGQHLQVSVSEITNLRPYGLGVADGLTNAEFKERYPEAAARMNLWRRGDLEIGDLMIPGAEDPQHYFRMGVDFLESLAKGHHSPLIVATRSVLVLLWNVIQGNTPNAGGGYREVSWRNSEIRSASIPGV